MIGINIKLVPGKTAPRYKANVKELTIKTAVITEQGTESNLPIVDIQLVDAEGNEYFAATTGRILNTLSSAVKGVNERNHGTPEP